MQVNLRPADYVGRRTFYPPRFIKLLLVVLYLLTLGAMPGLQWLQNKELEVETGVLSFTLESRQAETEKVRAALEAGNQLAIQSARLDEQLALRYRWSVILRELNQAAPAAGVVLSGFSWQQDNADLRVSGRTLRDSGRWPEEMEKTASFANVKLKTIEKVGEGFLVSLNAEVKSMSHLVAEPVLNDEPETPAQPPKPPTPAVDKEPDVPLVRDPKTYYIVRQTDSLSEIAKKFGITLDKLLAINPQIETPELIFPGQRISLPAAEN